MESIFYFVVDFELENVNVWGWNGMSCLFDVLVDFQNKLSVHSFFLLIDWHSKLLSLFFDVKVICNSPFMNVSFKRRTNSVLNPTDERFIHDVLISQVWHLLTRWSIDIASKLALFFFFGLLSCLDPLFVFCEFSVALLSFFHEIFSFWTLFHMLLAVLDILKNMTNIVFAVDSNWWPTFSQFKICIVISSLLSLPKFTLSFVLHQWADIGEIVTRLVLTRIYRFSFTVAASCYMEAPFPVLHQLMVGVERTNKDPCLCFWHSLVEFWE